MAHCHVHKNPSLVRNPSKINPVHVLVFDFCKVDFSTILSVPRSHKYFFPSGFLTEFYVFLLISPMCAMCPIHFILSGLISTIIIGEEYKLWSSSVCNFLLSHVTSYLHIFSSEYCSHIPSVYVLPLMWETKFYMCNTTGRIIVLYRLVFILVALWEDKSFWTEWKEASLPG
jgi:hypothetical protein